MKTIIDEKGKIKISKWDFKEEKKPFLDKVVSTDISREIIQIKKVAERKEIEIGIKEIISLGYVFKKGLFYTLLVWLKIYQKGFAKPIKSMRYYFNSSPSDFMKFFSIEIYADKKIISDPKKILSKEEVEGVIENEFLKYNLVLDYDELMNKTFFRKGWVVVPKKYLKFLKDRLCKMIATKLINLIDR